MARPKAIVPVSQVDDGYIRMMLYGDPGVGKTPLAATSPRCLIINADPTGTTSAAVQGSKADRWDIKGEDPWGEMQEVDEYIRHEGVNDYSWVWLDSITLFQERGLDQIMRELVISKPHRQVYLPDKGEYGQNFNRIKLWIRGMVAYPINFGIVAHVMREENEAGDVLMKPSIQGKNMSDTICGYMGIVAYMYARTKDGQQERGLITMKDSKRYAKDRFNALPKGRMLNPTIPKLEELVKAKLPRTSGNGTGARTRPTANVRTAQKRNTTRRTPTTRKVT